MSPTLKGATLAITGGTGSFGSTMAVHALTQGVARINILSRDEAKQDEMRRRLNDERVRFFIGDTRDRESLKPALRDVDYVFHAAALKQVPSCEFFPLQAVYTNVIGSDNVLSVAADSGVKVFVGLSTDKAVYPINAMGMSKALLEKTVQAYARNNPGSSLTVALTRYGNVMYSRGSVLPLFVHQLKTGQPLTVTDGKMTRFLMSLRDSVDLVEHAFGCQESGNLFVRKAPATTIETLAYAVACLFGVDQPDIHTIGYRHGEKKHETLLAAEDMVKATDEGDYFRVPLDARSLQYEQFFDEGTPIEPAEPYTSANARRLDVEETKALLLTLPEIQKELNG